MTGQPLQLDPAEPDAISRQAEARGDASLTAYVLALVAADALVA